MTQDRYQTSTRPGRPRRQRATIALTVLTTVALIGAGYSFDETASPTTSAPTSKAPTTSPARARDAAPRPPFTRQESEITPAVIDSFFDANPTSFQAPVWAANRDRAWQDYRNAVQRHGGV
jgi:hypothetical protein